MDTMVARFSSGNTRLADGAVKRIAHLALRWTEADLKLLRSAIESPIPEVAARARQALDRISEARTFVDSFDGTARGIAIQFRDIDGDPRGAMSVAQVLADSGAVDPEALVRLHAWFQQHCEMDVETAKAPHEIPGYLDGEFWHLTKKRPDGYVEAAFRALRGLARNPPDGAVPPLQRILFSGDEVFQLESTLLLLRLGAVPEVPGVTELRKDGFGSSWRVDVLEGSADPELSSLFGREFRSADLTTRECLVAPLARSRVASHRNLILEALRDTQCVICFAAREPAAGLPPEESTSRLIEMLSDARPRAQENAAWVLGEIRATKAAPALAKLASESPWIRVRVEAVRALGKCGGPAQREEVESFLESNEPEIVSAACEALTRFGGRASRPALRRVARRWEPPLRRAAARALVTLGDDDDRESIRESASCAGGVLPAALLGLLGAPADLAALQSRLHREAGSEFVGDWSDAIAFSGDLHAARSWPATVNGVHGYEPIMNLALLGAKEAQLAIGWSPVLADPACLIAVASTFGPKRVEALAEIVRRKLRRLDLPASDPAMLLATLALLRLSADPVDPRVFRHLIPFCESSRFSQWPDPEGEPERPPSILLMTPFLLETLAVHFEPRTAELWMKPFTLSREVSNPDDLAVAFGEAGLKLEGGDRAFVEGRIRKGIPVTPRWLAWRSGLETCVLEGGTVRAMPKSRAVAWWCERLESKSK